MRTVTGVGRVRRVRRVGRAAVSGLTLATTVIVASVGMSTLAGASVAGKHHPAPTTTTRKRGHKSTSSSGKASTTTTINAAAVQQAYCDANRSNALDDGEVLDQAGRQLAGRLITAASYDQPDPTLAADFAAQAPIAQALLTAAALAQIPSVIRADVTTIRNARVAMLEQGTTLASRPVDDPANFSAIGDFENATLSPEVATQSALDRVSDYLSNTCGL
jgi:hypothetical protein